MPVDACHAGLDARPIWSRIARCNTINCVQNKLRYINDALGASIPLRNSLDRVDPGEILFDTKSQDLFANNIAQKARRTCLVLPNLNSLRSNGFSERTCDMCLVLQSRRMLARYFLSCCSSCCSPSLQRLLQAPPRCRRRQSFLRVSISNFMFASRHQFAKQTSCA